MEPPPAPDKSWLPAGVANGLRRRLLAWYKTCRRDLPWRQTRDPYRIWVSEVMLQQTQVATVIPYYHRFLESFPDLASLARADRQAVLKHWEGLGYYRRAHHLHSAARQLIDAGDGGVPDRRKPFRALPGVGDYIANAVMSIAYDKPYAVVDGNVKRVLARLCGIGTAVNHPAAHREFQVVADRLLERKRPGTFNQALMELGALVCTPRNPDCNACHWQADCFARQNGVVATYPYRIRKKPVPEHAMVAGVICHRKRLLIVQRPSEGLLAGLWEFPGGRRREGERAEAACRRILHQTTGLAVTVEQKITQVRHAYTHFKIVLDLFLCRKDSGRVRLQGPQAFHWIRPDQLNVFPFPGAHKKAFPLLSCEILGAVKRRPA
ncbi:MAG: A/G-specific adenine glycosylase [Desulfosarcina sp.]|nr:A/G-specific adenine glycosylase [Desulfobacterales bacterium]